MSASSTVIDVFVWPRTFVSICAADFKIDCDGPLYLRMYWYSILMFIVYPIGIPVFFAVLLYVACLHQVS